MWTRKIPPVVEFASTAWGARRVTPSWRRVTRAPLYPPGTNKGGLTSNHITYCTLLLLYQVMKRFKYADLYRAWNLVNATTTFSAFCCPSPPLAPCTTCSPVPLDCLGFNFYLNGQRPNVSKKKICRGTYPT
jgi:hypothetical protein